MKSITINKNNFKSIVMDSDKPVLIDFWAPWCGPCRMQSPEVEELADEIGDNAIIGKLNVDEDPELAAEFDVFSIPTIVVIHKGRIINKNIGLTPKAKLNAMLEV
ncbi:MAG: thioredoxin [Clostridiales bacterium 43-6]|nr:MAG: thioredoxin [Clostridiales bacterium 43-6]